MTYLDLIDDIRAGASIRVCQQSGCNYDFRKYSEALSENGFPSLQAWLNNDWSGPNIAEYRRFLKTAIANGSFPMLAVAGIIASVSPHIHAMVFVRLPQSEKDRLNSLIQIGENLDDIGHHISHLRPNLKSIKGYSLNA